MDIAKTKRRENIAEYILYLWQLEDLLRALQFSPEAIYAKLVKPLGLPEEQKQEVFLWYMDIVNLLREEGKEQQGHLEHTLHLIADLNNLHNQLMVLPVGAEYRRLYARVAPELPALKAKLKDPEISDVELFFRALYSVVLLRIQEAGKHGDAGKGCGTNPQAAADKDTDVSAAPDSIADSGKSRQKYIDDVLTLISPVVAELATVFRKVERGEVDLFGNAPNGDRHAAAAPEQGTQASSGAQDGPRPAAVAPEGKNSRNSGTGSAS